MDWYVAGAAWLFHRDIKRARESAPAPTLRGSINVFLWLFAFFVLALSLALVFRPSLLWLVVSLMIMVPIARYWPMRWRKKREANEAVQ